ncbi:MAG: sulfite oxidase [Actinomycetia bacterium]|nr:sulfite oxidase [Actinomycetes bacterium]
MPQPTQAGSDPGRGFPWFKDPAPFIEHDSKSLESRLENMQGLITPNRLFFVRNNSASLSLGASEWRLAVEGNAVAGAMELTYDDIRSLPSRTLTCYLECAGNHRAMFDLVKGQKASGTQWMTGGVSNGEWAGAALRDVLTLAGIHASAVSVLLVGLDAKSPEGGFRYVLPVEKAMHPETLLAYTLNGETLPKDHGFPLRVLVPGWVGSANIKWLGRIVVSSERMWTRNNTTSYVLVGDRYPPQGESRGEPVTVQVIKSALALPWPGELAAGRHRIGGYAHSPTGLISRVEWSADSGRTWTDAEVSGRQPDRSWARFEFVWEAEPGERTIMTRATDVEGNTQPDWVPFNERGYLFNQPVPHPIRVT